MPKYLRTFLPAVAAFAAAALAAAAEPSEKPVDEAIYDRIKSLSGDWTGHMEDPLAGPPVAVRYEVASAGRAVVEYQNTGESFEAMTVYFLAGGKLGARHYSAAGNQPAFKLGAESTGDLVLLAFDGGTGFDADHDGHVHQGEIRFVSPDRIEQRWFHYVGPKEQGVTHWFLERKTAEAKPAPVEPTPRAGGRFQREAFKRGQSAFEGDAHLCLNSAKGERPLRIAPLVLVVLAGLAADAVGGILLRVEGQLRFRGVEQVDVEPVGDADEKPEDVGEFLGRALLAPGVERRALCLGQPLKQLDQLRRLDRQRHREVFRAVEAIPVALGDEFAQSLPQFGQIPHVATLAQPPLRRNGLNLRRNGFASPSP